MKKRTFFLFILVLLLGATAITGNLIAPVGTAYAAKTLCSCVFVSGRTEADVLAQELKTRWYVSTAVDYSEGLATGSILGLWKRTAIVREGLGCTILHGKTLAELDARKLDRSGIPYAEKVLIDYHDSLSLDLAVDWDQLAAGIEYAFTEPKEGETRRNTRAVLVLKDSIVLAERYAPGYGPETPQLGWSMTKSVTQAMIGMLIQDGKLSLYEPAPVPEWQGEGDPRSGIILDQLLRMSSGLAFEEVYFPPADATTMLFEEADAGAYAAAQPLEVSPDTKWSYSSGTTNILSRLVKQTVGEEAAYLRFPHERIFGPLGMRQSILETDASNTYVGSSFMYAPARDWAKFGLLYLRDGLWRGKRLLPVGWVAYTRTATPVSPQGEYGAQFWLNAGINAAGDDRPFPSLPTDVYYPSGFEGQHVFIIPSLDLVVVRLGYTPDRADFELEVFLRGILEAFVTKPL